jgi:hypothetical protein
MKLVYIAGALTDMPTADRAKLRAFYEQIAGACHQFGLEPYAPHQHSDPELFARLSPEQVNRIDRLAVTQSYLVVAYVGLAATGVGIELEMAYHANKPVVLLYEQAKLEAHRISRLVLGNPAVAHHIAFTTYADAAEQLRDYIKTFAYKIQDEHVPEPLMLRDDTDNSA